MKITERVIKNAVYGMMAIIRSRGTDKQLSSYICLRSGDEHYIDYIVENISWFYNTPGDPNTFVYWDNSTYGFTFVLSTFEEGKKKYNEFLKEKKLSPKEE